MPFAVTVNCIISLQGPSPALFRVLDPPLAGARCEGLRRSNRACARSGSATRLIYGMPLLNLRSNTCIVNPELIRGCHRYSIPVIGRDGRVDVPAWRHKCRCSRRPAGSDEFLDWVPWLNFIISSSRHKSLSRRVEQREKLVRNHSPSFFIKGYGH
jgi:hypothetical protein